MNFLRLLFTVIALLSVRAVYCEDSVHMFQPDDYPERIATRVCPFDPKSPNVENPSYIVSRFDDVEIYAQAVVTPTNASAPLQTFKKGKLELFFDDYKPQVVEIHKDKFTTYAQFAQSVVCSETLISKTGTDKPQRAHFEIGVLRDGLYKWGVSPTEPLREQDIILFRFLVPLPTSAIAIPHNGDNLELTKPLERTRLPTVAFDRDDIEAGDTWDKVQIFISGRIARDVSLLNRPFEPGVSTWSSVKSLLLPSINPGTDGVLWSARLLPRHTTYPVPGDTIQIFRMESQGLGGATAAATTNREPRVWQYSAAVDSDGFVWIPPVQASGEFDNQEPQDRMRLRRNGERDSAFYRVQLWSGDRSQRFPLEELGVALGGIGAEFPRYALSAPCRSAMCDNHIFKNISATQRRLTEVRYHVEMTPGKCKMVLDGQIIEVPFRRGYLLDMAIEHAFRIHKGIRFNFRTMRCDATVVPDSERQPYANDTPFRIVFSPGSQPNPDGALLLPGDTLILNTEH